MNYKCNIHGIEQKLVQGFTISEEYNETLDSGSVVIGASPYIEDLEPYDDVFIYSEKDMNGNDFVFRGYPVNETNYPNGTMPQYYKHLLVDQYTEEQLFLGDAEVDQIFKYTIQLFSETKRLEVIQLPNISITQPLNSAKKVSIYEYAEQFLGLYNISVKKNSQSGWVYQNKYSLSPSIEDMFENTYSPDFTLNNPSLRDLLNKLFITRDCIPYVKDDVIYALDISQRTGDFDYTKGELNYITGSKTSDGYCTDLKTNYTDALSEPNNGKYVEYLGFRNSESALMKFEDLRIETRFPIYKINKIFMCYYKQIKVKLANHEKLFDELIYEVGSQLVLYNSLNSQIDYKSLTVTIREDNYYEFNTPSGSGTQIIYSEESTETPGIFREFKVDYSDDKITKIYITCNSLNENEDFGEGFGDVYYILYDSLQTESKMFLCKQDITPLVKLDSERNLLIQDPELFMENATTIEEISKFKISTVGYSIGSTNISGWGTKYTYPKNFFYQNKEASYIENIFNFMDKNYPTGIYDKAYILKEILHKNVLRDIENYSTGAITGTGKIVNQPVAELALSKISGSGKFDVLEDLIMAKNIPLQLKSIFFQIEYQPFFNGVITHSKTFGKDNITINDNQSTSLALLKKDGISQIEKINRFSNKSLQIMARYTDINDVQPLGSVYGKTPYEDVVIYHRDISINDNVINVNYAGMKDYVLRNYFTSVFARYRTYNLMSYGESVTRSENEKMYILMSRDKYYNDALNVNISKFDDNFENNKLAFLKKFFSFFKENAMDKVTNYNEELIKKIDNINSGFLVYNNEYYSSDINAFASGNSMCFNVSMFDNVSAGVYIKSLITDVVKYSLEPYYFGSFGLTSDDLNNDDDEEGHKNYTGTMIDYHYIIDDFETGKTQNLSFIFCNSKNNYIHEEEFFDAYSATGYEKVVEAYNQLYELPRVLNYEESEEDDGNIVFSNIISFGKNYYLDNKEKLNMTFQIEVLNDNTMYEDKNDVLFNTNLISLSDLITSDTRIAKGFETTAYKGSKFDIKDLNASIDYTDGLKDDTILYDDIYKGVYRTIISFNIYKEIKSGYHVFNNGRINFPSQKHSSYRFGREYREYGYSSYIDLKGITINLANNEGTVTVDFYNYIHAAPNISETIKVGENSIQANNVKFVITRIEENGIFKCYNFRFDGYAVNGYSYPDTPALVKYNNANLELNYSWFFYARKIGTKTATRNDMFFQYMGPNPSKIYSEQVEYQNNLVYVLADEMKKHEIYDEYSTLPSNFVEISERGNDFTIDIKKDNAGKCFLEINVSRNIENYKSFRCYYFRGNLAKVDETRTGKYEFVFAINNLKQGINKIYLSLLRQRDMKILDDMNMDSGLENYNYVAQRGRMVEE